MIEFKNVSKVYCLNRKDKVLAIDDVSFRLADKGMIFIIGASGSGKSTLLNLMGLLDVSDDGEIIVNNRVINNFKSKEIDYYRNTYVGFVFQEYNLLEAFNVSENIEIALDLQKQKKNKEKINKVLDLVGLSGLGNRKVNELSGGQKQRVAIGRAIIKNPNMILADEPTGNLDYNNSEQIFNILKQISAEKLVVVVTHNMEFAQKYADRIIELKNGKIVNDISRNNFDYSNQSFSLIKSKLSFFKSISLSFSNLKKKKMKLAITTLLITLSLSMFGFFSMLTRFDTVKTHAETLIKQGESRVEINKRVEGKDFTTASPIITFTKEEFKEVESKINKKIIKVSKAVENNNYLEIPFASEQNPYNIDKKNYAYYDFYPSYTLFLEQDLKQLSQLNLIGRVPTGKNEIVINKVYADYILHNGLETWNIDSDGNRKEESYFPKSYDEIVSDNKKIVFGSSYLIISGIIDENMSKYDELKVTLSDDMIINSTKLYEEFKTKYSTKLSEVIVLNNFFDTINLQPNNTMPLDFYKIAYKFDSYKFYPMTSIALINKKVKFYDGKGYQEVDKINDNEIIIGTAMLDELYENEYSTNLLEYLKQEKVKYENLVKAREQKIKEIEKQLEINPLYEYEYPPEIPEFDNRKLSTSFTEKYINEKQIIGKTISVEVNDLYLRTQNIKTETFNDFVIVGYSSEEIYNYFSRNSIFNKYMRENSEPISLYFYENDQKELESIFKMFPSSKAKYVSKTIFSKTIDDVEKVVKNVSGIASYFSAFALFFSIILFLFFTVSSVNSNKKSIGILRALGAKTSDIYKIFYLETFLVGLIALFLSSVVSYLSVNVANTLISSKLFINIEPIYFRVEVIFIMLVVLIILLSISFIIPIFKITKTKPIDTINSK